MDYLEHYGIKGMRWGTRRKRGSDGRVTGSSGRPTFDKSPKKLSDDDLSKAIKRLDMEKRYKELNAKPKTEGRKMAGRILRNVSESTMTKILGEVAYYAGKKAIAKKVGADKAKEIFPKKK